MYNLGNLLQELRKSKNVSMDKMIQDLEELFGINIAKSTISKWENNKSEPTMENAKILCSYFNVSLDYLLGLSKYKTKQEELNAYKENFIKFAKAHNKNYFEKEIVKNLNQLNDTGKKEAIKRVAELTEIPRYKKEENSNVTELPKKKEIWEEEGKEHLTPIACHDDNLTEDEKNTMNSIIDNYIKNNNKE